MKTEIKSALLRQERVITPLAYSINDAATALGVGRTTVFRLIREQKLSVVRVGTRTLITATELAAFLDRGGES